MLKITDQISLDERELEGDLVGDLEHATALAHGGTHIYEYQTIREVSPCNG